VVMGIADDQSGLENVLHSPIMLPSRARGTGPGGPR